MAEPFGLAADVLAVRPRIFTEPVVEVEDGQADPEQATEPVQGVQQGDRVGASGAGHDDHVAGADQIVPSNRRGDSLQQPGHRRRPGAGHQPEERRSTQACGWPISSRVGRCSGRSHTLEKPSCPAAATVSSTNR